jgi:hypothetical protein
MIYSNHHLTETLPLDTELTKFNWGENLGNYWGETGKQIKRSHLHETNIHLFCLHVYSSTNFLARSTQDLMPYSHEYVGSN